MDGLEEIVEGWLEGLWPALKAVCLPSAEVRVFAGGGPELGAGGGRGVFH